MCIMNTPLNTIGIGNPVPAGMNTLGSGDLFQFNKRKKKSNKIKTIKTYNYNLNPPLIVYKKK